jgi:hypothetical protein
VSIAEQRFYIYHNRHSAFLDEDELARRIATGVGKRMATLLQSPCADARSRSNRGFIAFAPNKRAGNTT